MKKRVSHYCYYCHKAIKFDPEIRSPNSILIPQEVDGSGNHDCPKSPYKRRTKGLVAV